jgi:hypothetical protein
LATALLELAGDRSELTRLRRLAQQLAGQQFTPERIVAPLAGQLLPARGTAGAAQHSR